MLVRRTISAWLLTEVSYIGCSQFNITSSKIPTAGRAEHGSTVKELQPVIQAGFESGTCGFEVRRPNHSVTLPP